MKKSFMRRAIREGIVDTRKYRYWAKMLEYTPFEDSAWEYESAVFDVRRLEIDRVDHLVNDWDWQPVARIRYDNPKVGPDKLTVLNVMIRYW